MTKDPWSKKEESMLFTDMTNEEISRKIHRSVTAVKRKRYLVTGSYICEQDKVLSDHRILCNEPNYMSKEYKELRIKTLAKNLGIRLEG